MSYRSGVLVTTRSCASAGLGSSPAAASDSVNRRSLDIMYLTASEWVRLVRADRERGLQQQSGGAAESLQRSALHRCGQLGELAGEKGENPAAGREGDAVRLGILHPVVPAADKGPAAHLVPGKEIGAGVVP